MEQYEKRQIEWALTALLIIEIVKDGARYTLRALI